MRCRNMLLGGAALLALAGAFAFAPSYAQTSNMPAQQSQSAQPSDNQPAAADSSAAPTKTHHTAHHRTHHTRTASTESRRERQTTKQLNEQQLAQAQSQNGAQIAQTNTSTQYGAQGNSGPMNATGAMAQNGQMAQSGQTEDANGNPLPPSMESKPGQSSSADAANPSGMTPNAPPSDASMGTNESMADAGQSAQGSGQTALVSNAGTTSSAQEPSASSITDAMANTQPTGRAENGQGMPSTGTSSATQEPLTQVQNPQQTLASAQVKGTSGNTIGTVSQIQSDSNGMPTKVEVKLDQSLGAGSRTIWINADQLQYEPGQNDLTTTLTNQQLMNSM